MQPFVKLGGSQWDVCNAATGNIQCSHGRCSGSHAVHAVCHCPPGCISRTGPGLRGMPAACQLGARIRPLAAAARGADAGMVALTRATVIVIVVMASLLLSCIIFPKSASMSARASAQKARN